MEFASHVCGIGGISAWYAANPGADHNLPHWLGARRDPKADAERRTFYGDVYGQAASRVFEKPLRWRKPCPAISAEARNSRSANVSGPPWRMVGSPVVDLNDSALVPGGVTGASAVIGAVVDSDRVREALASLSNEQRNVLTLSYFEDKPHSEIAAQLSNPPGTVKSRIRLAFARMREMPGDDR